MIEFIKGWSKYILGSEITEDEKNKANICFDCDKKYKGNLTILKDGKFKEIEGWQCSECFCPLSAIIRSDKKCPINKF